MAKKKQLYFEHDDCEKCFDEEYLQWKMFENGWDKIEVYEAMPGREKGIGWCKHFREAISTTHCGFDCPGYAQIWIEDEMRESRAGFCTHYNAWTYMKGDKVVLKFDINKINPNHTNNAR